MGSCSFSFESIINLLSASFPSQKKHLPLVVLSLANRQGLLCQAELALTNQICPPPTIALTTCMRQNENPTFRPWVHRTISILWSERTKLCCKPVSKAYVESFTSLFGFPWQYRHNHLPMCISQSFEPSLSQCIEPSTKRKAFYKLSSKKAITGINLIIKIVFSIFFYLALE